MGTRSRKKGQRARPGAEAKRERPGAEAKRAPAAPTASAPPVAQAKRAPAAPAPPVARPVSRSAHKDAVARAALEPLQPGERPWPIVASVLVTTTLGLVNFALFVAGVKPHVSGHKPQLPEILLFTGLMLVCAAGMWRLRYWAVLGFETLLAIGLLGFSLALIKVQSAFWAVACCAIIAAFGYLFWKLVRVMGRIQMPTPPARQR